MTDNLTLYEVTIHGVPLKVQDYTLSMTPYFVFRELLADCYGLRGRSFADGSVILDIGANVGIVSIYLAKLYPKCFIYAYEPLPLNFDNLCKNIFMNNTANVVPVPQAVTADGRDITMRFNYDNLGGATAHVGLPPYNEVKVKSVTLPSIVDTYAFDRVALLKMDVEGAEHEILASCNGTLDKVDFLAMEAHFSSGLRAKGYNAQTLAAQLRPLTQRRAVQVTAQEVPG